MQLGKILYSNLLPLLLGQRREMDDLIQPPQKFRGKELPQLFHIFPASAHGLESQAVAFLITAQVGSHYHHRIMKADPPAGGIRKNPFFHNLQQDSSHIRMGFFQLIQQHQAIRPPANRLSEFSPFFIAT